MSGRRHWVEPWEMRLVSRLGLSPLAVGLCAAGGLMAVYVAIESLFGPLLEDPFATQVFGFGIASVLSGYALAAGHAIGAAQNALLGELEGVMELPRPGARLLALGRRWGIGALALAGLFMFVVDDGVRDLMTRGQFTTDGLLSALVLPLSFFLTVRVTFFTMAFVASLSEAAEASLEVDLLEPERLAPLGRAGLQGSLLFIGVAAVASLSVVLTGGSWIEYTLVGALLVAGTAAFLYPVRGARGRIHQAKRRALTEVRRQIREDRERMANDVAAAQRLPALLAWEARIEGVSEWPFDTGTIARFSLLLLLPLLSWLGGALVERAVDTLLAP